MTDLSRKRERERLKPRREPYWQRLSLGQYLGFRRGADTWLVRYRDRSGKQHHQALTGVTDFDEAKETAEKWLKEMGAAPVRTVVKGTVRDALTAYLTWLREQGRESTAKNAEPKFRAVIWDDPIATIPLRSLTREDFREWRERLRPGRQPRSINRIVRDVQAGLNRAIQEGYVGTPHAWKVEPLADDREDSGETAVLLSPAQRAAIIDKASPAAAAFLRGLELTGARPGELAAATVADLDATHGTLLLRHRKGRPAKVRVRSVVLSGEGIAFFKVQAKSKTPAARLFLDAEGKPWERHEWAIEFRAAAAAVNARARGKSRIPEGASTYSFRHARISELLQVHHVDPLTVAAQTGTSVRMIELAYHRFIPAAMREKLEAAGKS
jgi:integrase